MTIKNPLFEIKVCPECEEVLIRKRCCVSCKIEGLIKERKINIDVYVCPTCKQVYTKSLINLKEFDAQWIPRLENYK